MGLTRSSSSPTHYDEAQPSNSPSTRSMSDRISTTASTSGGNPIDKYPQWAEKDPRGGMPEIGLGGWQDRRERLSTLVLHAP